MIAKTVTAFCRAYNIVYNNLSQAKKDEWKVAFQEYKLLPYALPNPPQVQTFSQYLKSVQQKAIPKNIRILNA